MSSVSAVARLRNVQVTTSPAATWIVALRVDGSPVLSSSPQEMSPRVKPSGDGSFSVTVYVPGATDVNVRVPASSSANEFGAAMVSVNVKPVPPDGNVLFSITIVPVPAPAG